jgi:hypothetical protein
VSLVVLAGIVVCCLGILFRTRIKRQARPVAQLSLSESIELPDDSLESLISGGLPVVEEPLQLPYEFEIFGRPLQMSLHRTDFAQTLNGPHYNIPAPSASAPDADVVAEPAEDSPRVPGDPKIRVDMRHPRSTTSVLDRVLATFEGDQP